MRALGGAALAVWLATSSVAGAEEYAVAYVERGEVEELYDEPYQEATSHPLRLAAYVLHPAGVALEWAIFRPFFELVTLNDTTKYVFGYDPTYDDDYRWTDELDPTRPAPP